MTLEFEVRPIQKSDDPHLTNVIRSVMPEFGANGPGFAIVDPEVESMFKAFQQSRRAYFTLLLNGEVVGGAGVAPLDHGDPEVCELRKMYFLPQVRGMGWGQKLMDLCMKTARELGYKKCYLETLENMDQAKKLYEKNGFKKLTGPMGNTGHFKCNAWYLLEL